jgi:hypothetical protein
MTNLHIPSKNEILDFAIVGAGIAGLTLANRLSTLGYSLEVFEKARGTGGRLSSKRVVNDQQQAMAFDLGCTSFSGKSEGFKMQLEHWHQCGVIKPWLENRQGNIEYVATPRNSGLTRYLSKDISCHFSTKIDSIEEFEGVWKLTYSSNDSDEKTAVFATHIVLAIPSAQAYDLLPQQPVLMNKMRNQINNVTLSPQWVLGLEITSDISQLSNLSFPENDVIHSISIETSKPSREHPRDSQVLQIQATAQWSHDHIDADKQKIASDMVKALEEVLNQPVKSTNRYVHRWLYSTVKNGISNINSNYISESGLSVIGDYFSNEHFGIEASWHSAIALVEKLTEAKKIQHSDRVVSNV